MDFLFCTVQFWVWARKEEACLNCLFSDRFLLQKQTVRSTTTMVANSSSSTVFLPNLSLQSDSNWKGIGKTRTVPPRIRNKNGRKSAFTSLKWLFKKNCGFYTFLHRHMKLQGQQNTSMCNRNQDLRHFYLKYIELLPNQYLYTLILSIQYFVFHNH